MGQTYILWTRCACCACCTCCACTTKSALTMTGQAATYTLLTASCRACAYIRAMSQCYRPSGQLQLSKDGLLVVANEYNLQRHM